MRPHNKGSKIIQSCPQSTFCFVHSCLFLIQRSFCPPHWHWHSVVHSSLSIFHLPPPCHTAIHRVSRLQLHRWTSWWPCLESVWSGVWSTLGKGSHTPPLAQAKRVSGRKICILFPLLLVLFEQPLHKENQWKKKEKLSGYIHHFLLFFPATDQGFFTQKCPSPSSQSHNSSLKQGRGRWTE